MIEKPTEFWVRHPYFDFVEGSSFGRVRTVDKVVVDKNGRKWPMYGRILAPHRVGCGYLQIRFNKDGEHVTRFIHRFIAECFIPNPDNLPEINHKDNNPLNNAPSNLEWCTHKYNIEYREKFGTPAKEAARMQMKPLIAINVKTKNSSKFMSRMEAERQLGVNHWNINKVLKGEYNHTSGYWFASADSDAIETVKDKFGNTVAHKVEQLMNEKMN